MSAAEHTFSLELFLPGCFRWSIWSRTDHQPCRPYSLVGRLWRITWHAAIFRTSKVHALPSHHHMKQPIAERLRAPHRGRCELVPRVGEHGRYAISIVDPQTLAPPVAVETERRLVRPCRYDIGAV